MLGTSIFARANDKTDHWSAENEAKDMNPMTLHNNNNL